MDQPSAAQDSQQVGQDQGSQPVEVRKKRTFSGRRRLGKIRIDGGEVLVWSEGKTLKFRKKHKRRVETISMEEIWHHAVGQLVLRNIPDQV